jgi:ligand-binding sensor domain-containing protein
VSYRKSSLQLFTQSELKDVIRDLGLPREKAEHLGSRLKEKYVLAAGISMYWYSSREQEFTSYFSQDGDSVLLQFSWVNTNIRRRV